MGLCVEDANRRAFPDIEAPFLAEKPGTEQAQPTATANINKVVLVASAHLHLWPRKLR